jgi:hypothetical protein
VLLLLAHGDHGSDASLTRRYGTALPCSRGDCADVLAEVAVWARSLDRDWVRHDAVGVIDNLALGMHDRPRGQFGAGCESRKM